MKIALPSVKDQVDGHFGHCESFAVFTLDDSMNIVKEERVVPPPGCGCKSNIVGTLAAMGVKVMLAGNMGGGAVGKLQASGIEVIRGCSGNLRDVVAAWAAGKVKDSGEGCSAHEHGHECH